MIEILTNDNKQTRGNEEIRDDILCGPYRFSSVKYRNVENHGPRFPLLETKAFSNVFQKMLLSFILLGEHFQHFDYRSCF